MQVECFPYPWVSLVAEKFYCDGARDLRDQVFIRRQFYFYNHIKSVERVSWWRFCFSDLSCLWNQFLLLTQVQLWCFCIWRRERISSSLPPFILSFLSLTLSLSCKGSNERKDFRVFWESVLCFEPGIIGVVILVLGTQRNKLLYSLPIRHSPLAFMGGREKLLPWLQPTRKPKRRLWCNNHK